MIPCSKVCVYQQDGVCSLEHAAPMGSLDGDCIHYVPPEGDQNTKNGTREIYYPEPVKPPYPNRD